MAILNDLVSQIFELNITGYVDVFSGSNLSACHR